MAEKKVNTTNEDEKKKKKKLFIIFGSILGAGAIATAIAVPCVLLGGNSKAQEVKVDVPEINGLVFSNQKAYVGKDYDTEISVNKTLTTSLLPDELKSVKSGNRTIADTEYTYNLADNKETAQFHIPGKYIEGDVTIDLELVSKVPNYFYFKNVGEENATLYTYFTTEEIDPTTVFPKLFYSSDPNKDLSQWENLPLGEEISSRIYVKDFNLKSGDSIYFYGDNPNGINKSKDEKEAFRFVGSLEEATTEKLAVGGNISSLVYGKDFESKNEVPCNCCYSNLFAQNYSIVTAKDLILPTEDLEIQCFYRMFYDCPKLECSPYLGASSDEILNTFCYSALFEKCEKIREIKVNFGIDNKWPELDGVSATKDWLDKTIEGGVFTRTFYWRGESNPTVTWNRDSDHVQEEWTITHWE